MRLSKSDIVGGLPAEVARDFMRFMTQREVDQEWAEDALRDRGVESPLDVLTRLEAEGYLEGHESQAGRRTWTTTIRGNGLAMASFGSLMTRAAAERLLREVVERARAYNAVPDRPLVIERLRVFGSYLDPSVSKLGDLDIELAFSKKDDSPEAALDYARRSGRRFGSYIERLFWPQQELVLFLRNRSRFINITDEDVSSFTTEALVVFERTGTAEETKR